MNSITTATAATTATIVEEDIDIKTKTKIENATEGLSYNCFSRLSNMVLESEKEKESPVYSTRRAGKENALTICNYIISSMKSEINPSDHYRKDIIILLCSLSTFFKNGKPFKEVTRDDLLSLLDSFRKAEDVDQLHKWIGTYNLYRIHLMRFFKWLYYPDIAPDKRPKPPVNQNIAQLKRKEKSIYKPTDLWTAQDDSLFLKYCPNPRVDVIMQCQGIHGI